MSAQLPMYINDSIGFLNIDTSDPTLSPHVVLLSSMNTVGQPITIRDSFGSASDTNIIMISTIKDINFSKEGGPGSNLYTITRPYGSITVTPQRARPTTTSTSWKAVNTFSFPDSTRAATIHLTTVSTLVADSLDVANTTIRNTTISSIHTTFLGISNTNNEFTVNISSSTLHRGLFSTTGAIYAGKQISTMSNLSVGRNASILHNAILGGTLKTSLGTSLTGNVGVCTSPNSSNALFVTGTHSNTGATYMGNTLAVASDTTVGGKITVTGNTTIQGTLQTTQGTSFLQGVGIGAENTTTNTLLVTGTQTTTGAASLGDTLSVTSGTSIQGTLQVAKGATFSASVGIGGANPTTNALLVTGTQSNTGAVGIAGRLEVTGNTILQGSLYMPYGANFTAPMGIGGTNTSTDALLVVGSEGITQNLYVGGNLNVNGPYAFLPRTAITGELTIQGTPIGSFLGNITHDYWIEAGTYTITPKSKKCSITIVGGGGGGGAGCSANGSSAAGSGGGSGYRTTFTVEFYDLTNAQFTFTIGAGGAGGSVCLGNSPAQGEPGAPYIYYRTTADGNSVKPYDGSPTSFRVTGSSILNNGLGGSRSGVSIIVGGGGAAQNSAGWDHPSYVGKGGNGFCGGGVGYYLQGTNYSGIPGVGSIPSQNGGENRHYSGNTSYRVNNTYVEHGGAYTLYPQAWGAGQGGSPSGLPMASISQIPQWNLTTFTAYGNTSNGVGHQGWGGATFWNQSGGKGSGGGGGGGPGGGNGGTCDYCQIDPTTGQMYLPENNVNGSLGQYDSSKVEFKGLYYPPGNYNAPNGIRYRESSAKTLPGYAGSPGILGGGGGGGGVVHFFGYPGDGGKGGDGYVEITWL